MKGIAALFLLLPSIVVSAQQPVGHWVFGQGAGITFFDNDSAAASSQIVNSLENTTVRYNDDSSGILFYSDANILRDGSGRLIADDINTHSTCTNCAVVVPSTKNDSTFILFHLGEVPPLGHCYPIFQCLNLYYTEIISGKDSVFILSKNTHINTPLLEEKLAIIKHANGIDWWLIMHEISAPPQCSRKYVKFIYGSGGLAGPYFQEIGTNHCDSENFFGEIVTSKSGNKIALALQGEKKIDILNFDRCTGELLNFQLINPSTLIEVYGLAFSKDESKLYASQGASGIDTMSIYQFDLEDDNTPTQIWESIDPLKVNGQLELAPDGKIYLAGSYGNSSINVPFNQYTQNLGVIHSPDSAGFSCDFRPYSFFLGDSSLSLLGLPHMSHYNLDPMPIYLANAGIDTFYCAGDTTIKGVLIGGDTIPGISYQWQPAPDFADLTAPSHYVKPPQSRWYYVSITDTNYVGPSCNSRLDSVYVEVRMCVGVGEAEELKAKVYPNPTNGILTVELPEGQVGTFTLFNLLGQKVFDTKTQGGQTTLNINLPQGVYIYRIEQGGKQTNGKLLVE